MQEVTRHGGGLVRQHCGRSAEAGGDECGCVRVWMRLCVSVVFKCLDMAFVVCYDLALGKAFDCREVLALHMANKLFAVCQKSSTRQTIYLPCVFLSCVFSRWHMANVFFSVCPI